MKATGVLLLVAVLGWWVSAAGVADVAGQGHGPTHWRNSLYHFAQNIFR